eukprot:gene3915-4279_t
MTSVKFSFEGEVRRAFIGENEERLSLSDVKQIAQQLFPSLQESTFFFQWVDDEGDLVNVSVECELQEALRVMKASKSILRFNIIADQASNKNKNEELPKPNSSYAGVEHPSIVCDECGMTPIKGIRYKCTVREDFDLCEACEAKHKQPYPMIKITDPSQAPHVLIYGFRDQERGKGKCPNGAWRRGMRPGHGAHFPHHHPHPGMMPPGDHMPPPPFGFPHPPFPHDHPHPGFPHHPHPHPHPHMPPPPFGCPFFKGKCDKGEGNNNNSSRFDRKFEKFSRKMEKAQNDIKNTFVAPIIDIVGGLFGPDQGDDREVPTNEEEQLEEELLEQAIRESMKENDTVIPEKPEHIETAPAAVPTLPKPALRYVRDITYPDGATIMPGSSFQKVWRVRNDGKHPWPAEASLVSYGGDVLGTEDVKVELPCVNPDEESDITVTLIAPSAPGLYTSYFRAQTKEGQYFGHRLWCSVVVGEDQGWQVINKSVSPASEVSKVDVAEEQTATAPPAPILLSKNQDVRLVHDSSEDILEASEHPMSASQVGAGQTNDSNKMRSLALLWRYELDALKEMGFDNAEVILPLLQVYLSCPVSLSTDKSKVPNLEGMQQVVAQLLEDSSA